MLGRCSHMTELQPGDFPAQGVDAFIAGRMRRSSNSTKWAETRSISAIERHSVELYPKDFSPFAFFAPSVQFRGIRPSRRA